MPVAVVLVMLQHLPVIWCLWVDARAQGAVAVHHLQQTPVSDTNFTPSSSLMFRHDDAVRPPSSRWASVADAPFIHKGPQ